MPDTGRPANPRGCPREPRARTAVTAGRLPRCPGCGQGPAGEAGQPADPGRDQAGPGGRGGPRYRPRPPAHRRAPTAGTRPRTGLDQAAVNHREPAGTPSGAAPEGGAHGTPRTRRPARGRRHGPQGSRTLRAGDQAAPPPEQTTHPAGRAAAGVCWPRRGLPGPDSREAAWRPPVSSGSAGRGVTSAWITAASPDGWSRARPGCRPASACRRDPRHPLARRAEGTAQRFTHMHVMSERCTWARFMHSHAYSLMVRPALSAIARILSTVPVGNQIDYALGNPWIPRS